MTTPTPDEMALAIATIESSRVTHVDWLSWQERTPDWEAWVARQPVSAGDPAHHRETIAAYDQVLDVLRRIGP